MSKRLLVRTRTRAVTPSLALAALLLVAPGCAPAGSPAVAPELQNHRTVAILPFSVAIAGNELPKGMPVEALHTQQRTEGKLFQRQLHAQLQEGQKKGRYTVEFQDIDRTDALLEQAGLTPDSLHRYAREEIAGALGVNAVISGTIRRSRPMSTAGAAVLGILTGVLTGTGGIWGSTNRVEVQIGINDGTTGELLWQHEEQVSGSVGSSPEGLVRTVMGSVASSRRFPYRRPR